MLFFDCGFIRRLLFEGKLNCSLPSNNNLLKPFSCYGKISYLYSITILAQLILTQHENGFRPFLKITYTNMLDKIRTDLEKFGFKVDPSAAKEDQDSFSQMGYTLFTTVQSNDIKMLNIPAYTKSEPHEPKNAKELFNKCS